MTLAQERAAIRSGITASRQATGAAERRAIGAAMEASRRGTLKSDLNALESSPRKSAQLRTLERKGARPATSGVGYWNPARMPSSGGGGIASPLTEKTKIVDGFIVPDRDLYESATTTTTDGIFTMLLSPIKTLKLTDANEAPADINLAAPKTPVTP